MRKAAVLTGDHPLRPARTVRAFYRRNDRPLTDSEIVGAALGERVALRKPWQEVSWNDGPEEGVEVRLETPFFRSSAGQRVLELGRIRWAEGRVARDLLLQGLGHTLDLTDEVRVNNLPEPAGGSWTGRVVWIGRKAYSLPLGLWG
jgi:hypothetical protein